MVGEMVDGRAASRADEWVVLRVALKGDSQVDNLVDCWVDLLEST